MRAQVLSAIRATGDATMITNVNGWLNEQALEYATKWDFPDLITKWRTTISSGAQFDATLPFIIRDVPRDMIKILEAKILDENVTPIQWHPMNIRPMNEFERKFYRADLKENPARPTDIALFIQENSVFPGGGGPFSFEENFEGLTAGSDLDTQGGWTVTSPTYVVGTVSTTNPLGGLQGVTFGQLGDGNGFPYRVDVDSSTQSFTRFRLRRPAGTTISNIYQFAASNGLDPTVINLLDPNATNYSWRVQVILTTTGTTNIILRAPNNTAVGVTLTETTVDNQLEVTIDADALVTVKWNGVDVLSQTAAVATVTRIHMTCLRIGTPEDGVIDDVVYDDTADETLFPNGIQVRSTNGSEDSALRAGVNIYTRIERTRIEKFETAAAPGTTVASLFTGFVYGVIGIGKSAASNGIIIFESRDLVPVLIAELMPWEMSATFLTLQLDPFTDATYELHLTYKRSPPIMVNNSDTTFLLPSLLQGAIIQGAIVRGLEYNEDLQAVPAAMETQRKKEAKFVLEYFPELIEESHTYIG